MTRTTLRYATLAAFTLVAGICQSADAAVLRGVDWVDNTGGIDNFPTSGDFADQTNGTDLGTVSAYGNDAGGFFYAPTRQIVWVHNSGEVFSYGSRSAFANNLGTSLGTPVGGALGNDAGGFYYPPTGRIYWINNGGTVISFGNLADFAGFTNGTSHGTPVGGNLGNDPGGYYDYVTETIIWVNNIGNVQSFSTLSNFLTFTGAGTLLGTTAALGNDAGGFGVPLPEPSTFGLALAGLALVRRRRRK